MWYLMKIIICIWIFRFTIAILWDDSWDNRWDKKKQ